VSRKKKQPSQTTQQIQTNLLVVHAAQVAQGVGVGVDGGVGDTLRLKALNQQKEELADVAGELAGGLALDQLAVEQLVGVGVDVLVAVLGDETLVVAFARLRALARVQRLAHLGRRGVVQHVRLDVANVGGDQRLALGLVRAGERAQLLQLRLDLGRGFVVARVVLADGDNALAHCAQACRRAWRLNLHIMQRAHVCNFIERQ
jgi:hypothetical protein